MYSVQNKNFPPWHTLCNRLITARIAYSVEASRGYVPTHELLVVTSHDCQKVFS